MGNTLKECSIGLYDKSEQQIEPVIKAIYRNLNYDPNGTKKTENYLDDLKVSF